LTDAATFDEACFERRLGMLQVHDCCFLVIYASKSVVMFPNTEISPRSNNWPDGAQDTCVIQAEAAESLYKENKIAVCRLCF